MRDSVGRARTSCIGCTAVSATLDMAARIIVHGNQTKDVPDSYTRYLANVFRKEFDLFASPVAVEYRGGENPYDTARKTGHETIKKNRAKASRTRGRRS